MKIQSNSKRVGRLNIKSQHIRSRTCFLEYNLSGSGSFNKSLFLQIFFQTNFCIGSYFFRWFPLHAFLITTRVLNFWTFFTQFFFSLSFTTDHFKRKFRYSREISSLLYSSFCFTSASVFARFFFSNEKYSIVRNIFVLYAINNVECEINHPIIFFSIIIYI